MMIPLRPKAAFFTVAWLALAAFTVHGSDAVIDSMDAMTFRQPPRNGKVELVEGREGKALKFTFEEGAKSSFAIGRQRGNADWDKAAGFSFWVKGDGSQSLGGLEFIWNEDYEVRYDVAFPIDSTEWKKITVAWRDLVPGKVSAKTLPLDAVKGNAPSKLGPVWFGKLWFWKEYPAHSYVIDDLRLEPVIARDETDYTPKGAPLARTLAKLKAKQPITIVTVGDSLTDLSHWANKPANWPGILQGKLKERFGAEVTMINPAIGGTQLPHGCVVMPRWSGKAPDLVTILYGGNDWEAGARGPQFAEGMKDAIERVRRATQGKADVLVITSCPSLERWDTLAELAEACRQAAKERNAGLAEAWRGFHATPAEGRAALYVRDKVHLAGPGHEVVAKAVMEAIGE
jgi:lysophospholipase L1-like esterase